MEKIRKTDEEWREELDPDRYAVLRCAATEPPWSGDLNFVKEDGVFRCGACGAELFRSDAKFDSGSGWPSFFQPAEEDAVETEVDETHGMRRIEVRCAACDSHLGHVVPGRPAADRAALLHQLARARLRAASSCSAGTGLERCPTRSQSGACRLLGSALVFPRAEGGAA